MGKRKTPQVRQQPTDLNPAGIRMGGATSLDSSTQPKPQHPLANFRWQRESVRPRNNGGAPPTA